MPSSLTSTVTDPLARRTATVASVAWEYFETFASASEITLVPYEQAYEAGFEDMLRRAPDITKIQRLIGYRPGLGLPEMLERVISYERERRE